MQPAYSTPTSYQHFMTRSRAEALFPWKHNDLE